MKSDVRPSAMRLFVAICRMCDRGRRITLRRLADEMGWKSPNSILETLRILRGKGLVSYDDRSAGTIRPLYRLEVWVYG